MDKFIRLNKAKNCSIKILSGHKIIDESFYFVLLAIIDNLSIMLIDRHTEHLHIQINEFKIYLSK